MILGGLFPGTDSRNFAQAFLAASLAQKGLGRGSKSRQGGGEGCEECKKMWNVQSWFQQKAKCACSEVVYDSTSCEVALQALHSIKGSCVVVDGKSAASLACFNAAVDSRV